MFAIRLFPFALTALLLALPARADDEKARETPQEAFEAFKEAVLQGDGDGIWDFISKSSRKKVVEQMEESVTALRKDQDAMAELAKKTGKTVEELGKMDTEQLVKTKMIATIKADSQDVRESFWVGAEVKGNEAICTIKTKKGEEGEEGEVVLVLEEGRWRFDVEKSDELRESKDKNENGGGKEEDGDEGEK